MPCAHCHDVEQELDMPFTSLCSSFFTFPTRKEHECFCMSASTSPSLAERTNLTEILLSWTTEGAY
eukprot:scaffold14906_cov21-Tisochrysis_lutea.AAC.1